MIRNTLIGCALAALNLPTLAQTLVTNPVASGLSSPVVITHAGDGSDRLFVIEQAGRIRLIHSDGTMQPLPFLDIVPRVNSGGEQGLLGLAFHPEYETNGLFYVNYTGTFEGRLHTIIEEFSVSSADPNAGDSSSGRILMTISQPAGNHNGGWIGFGPDGLLYIATGDGGSGNDPWNNASSLDVHLGKILRIDVDSQDAGLEYAIPADNPFASDGNANTFGEIWHYGLRNPWRCGFDRETGDLWIGDVGQNAREEVNMQGADEPGGNHYGWRCREGFISTPGISCSDNPDWVDPVYDYSAGCSVIGGYVYRGCELGETFQGKYFFADFCNGDIWNLDPSNGFTRSTVHPTNLGVSAFGEDEKGELYVADLFGGRVYKIELQNPVDADGDTVIDSCATNPGCNEADLAEPYGTLNFFDLGQFLTLFNAQDPAADLAAPAGVFNFFDLGEFLTIFNQGCP